MILPLYSNCLPAFLCHCRIWSMAFTALHMSAELPEVQGTDFASKEQPAPDQPTHRHMINMVFPAQYGGDGLYSVTEVGQLLEFLRIPVSLLFGTPFCVC